MTTAAPPTTATHLVEVAFKGNRKEFFRWDAAEPPRVGAAIVVEGDRGEDLGRVHATGELAVKRFAGVAHGAALLGPEAHPTRRALRLATRDDERRADDLPRLDEEARRKAMERVKAHALVMKLSDAEWQWDRKKLTLYFTAEKRVDFRALVRDLASLFRARIELKQIGVRDEAKRLSGVGRCGREYCSSSWLPELRPVNLNVAKDQRLSLNPTQISGACGRLMCSLRYEHEFYVQQRRRFPKEGKVLVTGRGEEKVVANDIFRERVTLRALDGEVRVVPLDTLRAELEGLAPGAPPRDADADAVADAAGARGSDAMVDTSGDVAGDAFGTAVRDAAGDAAGDAADGAATETLPRALDATRPVDGDAREDRRRGDDRRREPLREASRAERPDRSSRPAPSRPTAATPAPPPAPLSDAEREARRDAARDVARGLARGLARGTSSAAPAAADASADANATDQVSAGADASAVVSAGASTHAAATPPSASDALNAVAPDAADVAAPTPVPTSQAPAAAPDDADEGDDDAPDGPDADDPAATDADGTPRPRRRRGRRGGRRNRARGSTPADQPEEPGAPPSAPPPDPTAG